jgi:hypothetical protein
LTSVSFQIVPKRSTTVPEKPAKKSAKKEKDKEASSAPITITKAPVPIIQLTNQVPQATFSTLPAQNPSITADDDYDMME